jgi:hypothetical protein
MLFFITFKDDSDEDTEKKKFQNKLEGAIVVEKPNVKWSDVAGLEVKYTVTLPIVSDPEPDADPHSIGDPDPYSECRSWSRRGKKSKNEEEN